MRIEVRNAGRKADPGLKNYAGLRLMSVLDHLTRGVEGVTVHLDRVERADEPKARCSMLARLATSAEARAEATDAGPYTAIDRAAARLSAAVAQQLLRTSARPARQPARPEPSATP